MGWWFSHYRKTFPHSQFSKGVEKLLRDRVNKAAKEIGISVYQLERLAGLKCGTINKWNRVVPRADNLLAVARILGKTAEYLMGGDAA